MTPLNVEKLVVSYWPAVKGYVCAFLHLEKRYNIISKICIKKNQQPHSKYVCLFLDFQIHLLMMSVMVARWCSTLMMHVIMPLLWLFPFPVISVKLWGKSWWTVTMATSSQEAGETVWPISAMGRSPPAGRPRLLQVCAAPDDSLPDHFLLYAMCPIYSEPSLLPGDKNVTPAFPVWIASRRTFLRKSSECVRSRYLFRGNWLQLIGKLRFDQTLTQTYHKCHLFGHLLTSCP